MISFLSRMLTCHWSARRIQRYLDADPSAPLQEAEIRRLEAHLTACAACSDLVDEHRLLHRVLSRWSGQQLPDQAAVARLHAALDRIVEGQLP